MFRRILSFVLLCVACAPQVHVEAVPADQLAVRSTGETAENHHWKMAKNGYVGAYLQVKTPGEVAVTLNAYGLSAGGEGPRMRVSIGDQHRYFRVTRGDAPHRAAFILKPGTYFLRVAFINDVPDLDDALIVESLEIEDATLINEHTDALALAAADTHVEHNRRGPVRIHLPGVRPGTPVHARLTRLAFNLGANIPGTSNVYLIDNPEPGSEAAQFQKHFLECFNTTVPSNAGKWAYNEADRDVLTMDYVDTIMDFAEVHGLRMRMHALIWDTSQQPVWVQTLIAAALEGDADAKAQLREEITERIGYYVRDRAGRFDAIDVLNESFHQPAYLDIFGIEGIADIYRETAEAIDQGDGEAQTFINEFNLFQWSQRPPYDTDDAEPDPFANWYREHAEALLRHDARLGAIGVQYYADPREDISDRHSPARIVQVLHNLSLTGLPISLTEFGVGRGATPEQAATILSDTMRLMFGHPNGQTFLMFGFYRGATWDRAAEATLFDNDWSRSLPGQAYQELIGQWMTDVTVNLDADGYATFDGYYGDYAVTVDGRTYPLAVVKGTTDYEIRP